MRSLAGLRQVDSPYQALRPFPFRGCLHIYSADSLFVSIWWEFRLAGLEGGEWEMGSLHTDHSFSATHVWPYGHKKGRTPWLRARREQYFHRRRLMVWTGLWSMHAEIRGRCCGALWVEGERRKQSAKGTEKRGRSEVPVLGCGLFGALRMGCFFSYSFDLDTFFVLHLRLGHLT